VSLEAAAGGQPVSGASLMIGHLFARRHFLGQSVSEEIEAVGTVEGTSFDGG